MRVLPSPRPELRLVPPLPTTSPLPTPGTAATPTTAAPLRQARAWTVEVLRLVALKAVAGPPPTAGHDLEDDVVQAPSGASRATPSSRGALHPARRAVRRSALRRAQPLHRAAVPQQRRRLLARPGDTGPGSPHRPLRSSPVTGTPHPPPEGGSLPQGAALRRVPGRRLVRAGPARRGRPPCGDRPRCRAGAAGGAGLRSPCRPCRRRRRAAGGGLLRLVGDDGLGGEEERGDATRRSAARSG